MAFFWQNPSAPFRDWRDKAHAIIGEMSKQSYEQAQRTAAGGKRKRHVPYSIPETAEKLVEALGRDDEETAKSIMMYDYDAQQAWNAVQTRRSSNSVGSEDPAAHARRISEILKAQGERYRFLVVSKRPTGPGLVVEAYDDFVRAREAAEEEATEEHKAVEIRDAWLDGEVVWRTEAM